MTDFGAQTDFDSPRQRSGGPLLDSSVIRQAWLVGWQHFPLVADAVLLVSSRGRRSSQDLAKIEICPKVNLLLIVSNDYRSVHCALAHQNPVQRSSPRPSAVDKVECKNTTYFQINV